MTAQQSESGATVTILCPAYNEEDNIGTFLEELAVATSALDGYTFDVVIVDDGSTDGTADKCESYRERFARFELIRSPSNEGFGRTIRKGMEHCTGQWVIMMDSDGQLVADDIGRFLSEGEQNSYDLICGRRTPRRDRWHRKLLTWCYNFIFRRLFGLTVHDVDCTFKLFRRTVLEQIKLRYVHMPIGPELAVRALRLGAKIGEIPIGHRHRIHGQSVFSFWNIVRVSIGSISLMLRLRFEPRES